MQNTAEKIRVEVEELSSVKKKLNILVPREGVEKEFRAAYEELKANAQIAGFRKGAVPINVLKVKFGDRVKEDVTARLIEVTYSQAVKEKDLTPVDRPHVEVPDARVEEGKDFSYSVTLEVAPKVDISGYKEIDIKKEKVEVAEADVEEALQKLQETHVGFREVDRPSQKDDLVTVDFEGFINGEPIKGYKATDYTVIIGHVTPLPGFDEAVAGASKGDVREAKVKFPPNYSEKSLKGKDAVFKITVKTVKERTPAVLNDDLAKDFGCEDLGKLREKLKGEITKAKEKNEKEREKNLVLDRLIEKHPFDVPESMVNRYLGVILRNVAQNMAQGIIAEEDKNLKPEDLREKYRAEAARRVKEDIILDSIVQKENVQVSDEEMKAAMKFLADSRGVSVEALMNQIQREGVYDVVMDGLKHDKVFDIILASAKEA